MGERPFRTHRRSRPPARLTISSRVGSVTPSGSSRINSEVRAGIEYTSRSPFTFWSERPTASITICDESALRRPTADVGSSTGVDIRTTQAHDNVSGDRHRLDGESVGPPSERKRSDPRWPSFVPIYCRRWAVGGHSRLKHTVLVTDFLCHRSK